VRLRRCRASSAAGAGGRGAAPLVIVALPEIEPARLAVAAVRALRPDVPLLARAHGRAEAEALRAMGATEIIQPEVEPRPL